MPEWKEVVPVLSALLMGIAGLLAYTVAEWTRKRGEENAAKAPIQVAAVGQGLVDQTKLDLVLHAAENLTGLMVRVITLLERDQHDREREEMADDLLDEVLRRLKRDGVTLGPRAHKP